MARFKKISEIPQIEFSKQILDNCYHVDRDHFKVLAEVPMQSVFDFISENSKKGGLTVKNEGTQIIFISHKDALLESLEQMLEAFGPIADAYDEKELIIKVESAIKKAKGL